MIRVLHVLGGLNAGGTEAVIMNWYRHIDRSKIQFDFLIRSEDEYYRAEIEALGGRVYKTPAFPRRALRNWQATERVIARREWDVIHVHGNAAIYIVPLILAKQYAIPIRIMHSHNVKTAKNAYALIHRLNRELLVRYTTKHLACSDAAGQWMFKQHQFEVLKNAICIEQFAFDKYARKKVRQEIGAQDRLVVGHVGRLSIQKNHTFLINVFKEIRKQRPQSLLLLVGDGELRNQIEKQAKQDGLSDSIVWMGRRDDVHEVMSAMDVFVFPSLYEGLGNVLIEAQTNGLTCFVSREACMDEVRITDRLHTLSLRESAEVWAQAVLSGVENAPERTMDKAILEESGYDIREVTSRLEHIYKGG